MKLVLGTVVGISPGEFVLDGDLASPPQNGAERPLSFRPMFIGAKRLDG